MLYKYIYISNHEIHRLNKHLLYFFRKIRSISKNASFRIDQYFHPEFAIILKDPRTTTLKERFNAFFNAYKILGVDQKEEFYQRVLFCQSVEKYFENTAIDCTNINNVSMTALIGDDSLYELTTYLFTTTLKADKWGIKSHYKQMYDNMPPHKACPFCGVGEMHQTFREDYDHLALKKDYPLLAINLKNLVPMCIVCNTKFKKEADVFYNKKKARRICAYPYTTELSVSIDCTESTIPQTDINNPKGVWKIGFLPKDEINATWFEVFQISKRYIEDYLQPKFDIWVEYFIEDLISNGTSVQNSRELKKELKKTAEIYQKRKFDNSNIIKGPLFTYLANSENEIFYNSLIRMYNTKKAEVA